VCGLRLDLAGLGEHPAMGSCEHDHESLNIYKTDEFIDYMSDYELLKKGFFPWR